MTAQKANTFPLAYPFDFKGERINEVTLRRARGGDLERIEGADTDILKALVTISALADLPLDAVRNMDAEDIASVSEKLPDFLPKGRPATGGA